MFYGCLLYADDILLLCSSIKGLQLMLYMLYHLCFAGDPSLQFNCSK